MRQKLLPIQSEEVLDFNHYFISPANSPVIQYLQNIHPAHSPQPEKILYLTGKKSSGITHVLNATVNQYKKFIYLSNREELLNLKDEYHSEQFYAIAIDDVDKLLGNLDTEKALFNLYNFVVQQDKLRLYFASHQLPAHLNCQLPDLKSRMQALLVLSLKELADDEKISALEMRAQLRGFNIPREVSEYLLNHFPRDSQTLFQSLNKLDNLSLEEKRKLTIPFVKEVLF
jgi:DnaA family protein